MNSCYCLLRLVFVVFLLTGSLTEGMIIFGELGDELDGNENVLRGTAAAC